MPSLKRAGEAAPLPGLDLAPFPDLRHYRKLHEALSRLLDSAGPDAQAWAEALAELAACRFREIPDLAAYLGLQRQIHAIQEARLDAALDRLAASPSRLHLSGAAGCGKSRLALHVYRRALAAGKRPLLVCYNRPLRDALLAQVAEGGVVETFYGLCHRFLEQQGEHFSFTQTHYPRIWARMLERMADTAVPPQARFDSLIVDEAQDFEAAWYPILEKFLASRADLLWLDDPRQNLRGLPRFVPPGLTAYTLPVNYRSPRRIARFMRDTLKADGLSGNPLPGLEVGVALYASPEEQVELLSALARELSEQGLDYSEIVVLSASGLRQAAFARLERLGGAGLRRFSGAYDEAGNQVFTPGELYCESLYRFKGQQAPAVILTDVDPAAEQAEQAARLLLAGASRATLRLEILARADNPLNRAWLRR